MNQNISFKNATLDQLIVIARQSNFIPIEEPIEVLSDDDVMYLATYQFVNNPVFLRVCSYVCKTFPPLKLTLKSTLRNYIERLNR